MSLQIVRDDITNIRVDAVVCPTDRHFSGSGGSDHKIHKTAGKRLDEECLMLRPLNVGEAILTSSYDMKNCQHIIHTVGPIYKSDDDSIKLEKCYQSVLKVALDNNIESIAVPLVSSGTFAYPKKEALKIASKTINEFLIDNDLDVFLLVYDKEAFDVSKELFNDVKNYLEENGIFDVREERRESVVENSFSFLFKEKAVFEPSVKLPNLNDFRPDETFKEYLRRIIYEKNLIEKDVYKASNLTKQAFNKIYNEGSIPKKENALALAIGMKLNVDETIELLDRAGYSFNQKNKLNYIVRYFIEHEIYDIQLINEFLLDQDLISLGSKY